MYSGHFNTFVDWSAYKREHVLKLKLNNNRLPIQGLEN